MFMANGLESNIAVTPRLAIYSQDGFGLGHMRRTSAIAAQLLGICPAGCALTLSDSPLGQFFPIATNHDYLKLPSIVKEGPGQWRPARLPLSFQVVQEMRQELILTATMHFRPDIFLVDHMPHGSMGELLPTLEALKHKHPQTKIVLGLRDILDAPHVVAERWQAEGAYATVEAFYDRVLVYGMHELFDMVTHYDFPPAISQRFRYCGYICPPPATRKHTATQLQLDAKVKHIVVMAGGGADAYPMMAAVLDALALLTIDQGYHCLLITGPFMPEAERQELQQRARNLPVQVLTAVEDTYRFIYHADLIIAMAGYNTAVEILQCGTPAILIPRRGPSAEQRMRARFFAEKAWVSMLDPDELYGTQLADLINTILNRQAPPAMAIMPNLDGLTQSTHHLLDLLHHHYQSNGTAYKTRL